MIQEVAGIWQVGGTANYVPYRSVQIPSGETITVIVRITRTDNRPYELRNKFAYLRLIDRVNNQTVKSVQGAVDINNTVTFSVTPPPNSTGRSYIWNVLLEPDDGYDPTNIVASSVWAYT